MQIVIGILAAIAAMAAGWMYSAYSRARADAKEDVEEGSKITDTDMGPVHYTDIGEGPVVLLSHGGGGGSDHGKMLAPYLSGFRCITPSRFGYLYTPMAKHVTPKLQAEAFAAFLRKLNIDKAAVLASSGGTPSALRFASDYPDMCSALIIVSGISRPLPPFNPVAKLTYNIICLADFLSWLLFAFAGASIISNANMKGGDKKKLLKDEDGYRLLVKACRMAPTNMRRKGLMSDVTGCRQAESFTVEKINVPMLVFHGTSDSIVPWSQGEHAATLAEESEFVTIEGGGHLCIITHREEIFSKIKEFLQTKAGKLEA